MSDGILRSAELSPTAATAGDTKYGPSGPQLYRVVMQTAMGGIVTTDVKAATGDEAADLALKEVTGGRVTHIAPAPQKKG